MPLTGLKPLTDFGGGRVFVAAGPCAAESEEQVMDTALRLADVGRVSVFRAGVWKPRTKPGGFEGVGERALPWLGRVKRETGMPTATEVATRAHVVKALESGVDMLWVGARTSANPFAVQEIADTLADEGVAGEVPVMVKNPVNPDVELWIGALERLYNAGVRRLAAVHRGFSSYGTHLYRNPPQWHIAIELRRREPGLPVICDPSHIAGRSDLVGQVACQAMDMGFDGLMVESHCCPEQALSDSAQQLTPESLAELIGGLKCLSGGTRADVELERLRREIDGIDGDLLELVERRMSVCRRIGEYKRKHNMAVLQMTRHNQIMESQLAAAARMGISSEFMTTFLRAIHEESVRQQVQVVSKTEGYGK